MKLKNNLMVLEIISVFEIRGIEANCAHFRVKHQKTRCIHATAYMYIPDKSMQSRHPPQTHTDYEEAKKLRLFRPFRSDEGSQCHSASCIRQGPLGET